MFKFSLKWLQRESKTEISYEEMLDWLMQQGFEIALIKEAGDDKVIEIEVKANRPDMLSIAGVIREVYISKNIPVPPVFDVDIGVSFNPKNMLSHRINIKSKDVHRYYAIEIKGINNTGKSPPHISETLEKMGVTLINPVVDISNYVLLLTGQPIHVFDSDKIEGDITIQNVDKPVNFVTLNGLEVQLSKGSLLISDTKDPLCLAGIIGGTKAEIGRDTKNILIESANFDQIIIRTTSKKLHISTAASYRYERGVNTELSVTGARHMAKLISEICGGNVLKEGYCYIDKEYVPDVLKLSIKRVNSILGCQLSADKIAEMLRRCYFSVEKIDKEKLKVTVPDFRLDIKLDVDLIEEIGRIYGYHNIKPQPITLYAPYQENKVNKNSNILRNIMTGHGFIEILTYGFIPANSMKDLGIDKDSNYYGEIKILNPLSSYYELMRPTLVYGLLTTAINNMAVGKKDIKIFETGKIFSYKNGHIDSFENYIEKNSFAILVCGVKHKKGFGVSKDIMYCVYDTVAILKSILGKYNIPFIIKNTEKIGFFEKGAGAEIIIDNKPAGIIGKISRNVIERFENGKLAKNNMFYLEFCFDDFTENKKTISFESEFPGITREYNFIIKNGINFNDYKEIIINESRFIVDVLPLDVYFGKGIAEGTSAVLLSITYNAANRTLETNEIENIEIGFKTKLKEKFDIELKSF